ncbi:Crp/Fnr family transcriptional regulator [Variovorax sp. EL159]|uniref:Crp/Fnr family transcriptional regulator n=1 Tax=Variovorax sp. EL159 TaxID=1566270 RepID=UPI00088D1369|nr:Crp/Fnr family transcriptional regulator [Variovorax sp. EL159]SCX73923.1 cAMP-binding domain of CRP or a regulatory subunit of cAMP-dependent protein kinases [Variovorax sp. EL159]
MLERALRWNELFSRWPDARRADLMKSARLERYSRRTQVLAHDRHRRELLVVVSGCLEISSMSTHGRKYVNALLGPGQVAPLVRLLDDVPLAYDYHAHEDSVIVHLPCDAVIAVLDAEPILWRDVAKLGLQRQRLSIVLLQNQMLNSIRGRVAATLMSLIHFYSGQGDGDATPLVRLSQNDLAAMLGLSRQTINKELGRLVEEGAIDMSYKRIRIVDAERLARIAAGT